MKDPDPKHHFYCPNCGGRSFHAFPMCGTVAFQCASCKRVSLHTQLKGGDTSGEEPEPLKDE